MRCVFQKNKGKKKHLFVLIRHQSTLRLPIVTKTKTNAYRASLAMTESITEYGVEEDGKDSY